MSPSPTPSKSPTPTPTPSKSPTPTPTPTPTPKPKTPKLCVYVRPFSGSSVNPGGTATYEVWVWSTVAEAQGVGVTATIGRGAPAQTPGFTVCAKPSGNSCAVGGLPTGQAVELVAATRVRRAATAGERITLTATARATKADSFHAAATVKVVAAGTPGSSSSTSTPPALPGSTVGNGTPPSFPQGALTSPTNPSGLFPTVSPNASGSPAGVASSRRKNARRLSARDVSATLPLDTRLIGGQLAGLAVLATAIAVAIVRLSLRRPRPDDSGDAAK